MENMFRHIDFCMIYLNILISSSFKKYTSYHEPQTALDTPFFYYFTYYPLIMSFILQ